MYFNDWKVTINGKGSHDVVTNEDTFVNFARLSTC